MFFEDLWVGKKKEKLVTLKASGLQVSAGSKTLAKMSRTCLCTDDQYRAYLRSVQRVTLVQRSSF